jgi:hypothetical protein
MGSSSTRMETEGRLSSMWTWCVVPIYLPTSHYPPKFFIADHSISFFLLSLQCFLHCISDSVFQGKEFLAYLTWWLFAWKTIKETIPSFPLQSYVFGNLFFTFLGILF